jgi:hypothetical protein
MESSQLIVCLHLVRFAIFAHPYMLSERQWSVEITEWGSIPNSMISLIMVTQKLHKDYPWINNLVYMSSNIF